MHACTVCIFFPAKRESTEVNKLRNTFPEAIERGWLGESIRLAGFVKDCHPVLIISRNKKLAILQTFAMRIDGKAKIIVAFIAEFAISPKELREKLVRRPSVAR
ncbi:MAG: hypothetical protein ACF8CQ_01360 [Rhodopirellula sp. JB044]|uniref:hypothetical protein n=1 Tax=Rhodopirellula sp. JB044 TaxID=3342844 RepID=UPI00370B8E3F